MSLIKDPQNRTKFGTSIFKTTGVGFGLILIIIVIIKHLKDLTVSPDRNNITLGQ